MCCYIAQNNMKDAPFFSEAVSDVPQAQIVKVTNWDQITEWLFKRVGPVKLSPVTSTREPDGSLHSLRVGGINITHTRYGAPSAISIEGFSSAPVVATTNLQGHAFPQINGQETKANGTHMSFVFDLSEYGHQSRMSEDNVQLQLAIEPKLLDDIGRSWYGNLPDRKTWQIKTRFGGRGSSWYACLNYVMKLIAVSNRPLSQRSVQHVEETLCANLIENWATQAGLDVTEEDHVIVPRVIRMAEDYMVEHAADAPTLSEIANALGVSVRNLTMNFKKFRDCTPGQFLREQRLQAAHREFLAGGQGRTVSQIAASLSYIHMGEFAKIYRERFGENPSETLKRGG